MFNWYLNWLERHTRRRIIHDRTGLREYLIRYYIWWRDDGRDPANELDSKLPFNVLLHNIKLSDDPIYHDHPWSWCSIVLRGGYFEHRPGAFGDVKVWRRPGSICFRKATDLHYVELGKKDVWTLFIHGRRVRKWGFIYKGVWTYWRDFLAEKAVTN
jgi:hypothetical protein